MRRTDELELTFSCPRCAAVGHLADVSTATEIVCPECKTARPLHTAAIAASGVEVCPFCLTPDLYVQKDFPQGLGLAIVLVGFAISTVFWYYEKPIYSYLVLVVSMVLDLVLYYRVPDVTICYRCLCQLRGEGANPAGRFTPFDLAVGERYRQERLRIEQLRGQGKVAE